MLKQMMEVVSKIETQLVPWLPYGLVPGAKFRVLQVDNDNNIVVLNFWMGPHTVTQKHDHHCTAMAYTLQGEWAYGDRIFRQGDLAYELPGEVHQPVTHDESAELLTILIGGRGNERFLQNFEEDGSTYVLGMRFFRAVERVTPAQLEKLDLQALLDPA